MVRGGKNQQWIFLEKPLLFWYHFTFNSDYKLVKQPHGQTTSATERRDFEIAYSVAWDRKGIWILLPAFLLQNG